MEEAGHRMVRYADDFVILCQTAAEADEALARVRAWVDANGLTLQRADRLLQHRSASRLDPTKTHVGDCAQPGQGFEFLGYRFEAGQRRMRQKSLNALQDRVRVRTIRSRGDSLGRVIADINPLLRGWFEYLQHAQPALGMFRRIDKMIRRRLRAILRKQDHRPGMGRAKAAHLRWTNACFASQGLFTSATALGEARHSR